jgi:DNA-binding NtrC family response regulator
MTAKSPIVLIANSDDASCFMYKEVLESMSIDSIVAKNGIITLHEYNSNNRINIVLTEIRLYYLDGIQLLHGIRNLRKNIKVALLTASATLSDIEKYKDVGFRWILFVQILIQA